MSEKIWADCMIGNEHWLQNLKPPQVRSLAGRYQIEGWETAPIDVLLDEIRKIRDAKVANQ